MERHADDREARTVLLVEDNPTDIFVIKEVLGSCGVKLNLRIARDGHEALEYLQNLAYDKNAECPALVLLDLNLPRVAGIEFLRELRSASRCPQTPVVVVTSSLAESDRVSAQELGAEAYFQKPTDLKLYMQLGTLIKDVLARDEKRGNR